MQVIELDPSPPQLQQTRTKPISKQDKSKQKKSDRACDFCRKRKTKCDGPWSKDRICSNCRSARIDCSYIELSKPRGPPKAYIITLEDQVEKTEQLLRRLRPDMDLPLELGPPIERDSWKADAVYTQRSASLQNNTQSRSSGSPEIGVSLRVGMSNTSNRPSSSSPPHISAAEAMTYPYSNSDSEDDVTNAGHGRYQGKSSSAGLVNATVKVKKEYDHDYEPQISFEGDLPEYEIRTWRELPPRKAFNFPPPDLMDSLIALYFENVNPYFALLHKPTFEAQYRSNLHMRDRAFAAMFLGLLALSSRWSDDCRVFESKTAAKMSCGWKFFEEAKKYQPSALAPACLFDVQRFALQSAFLRWTTHQPASWNMVALGLRLAQDMGAHRKRRYQEHPTVEDELWKRAFWLLVVYDRLGSASLGRPCCSREEDFDVELPLEVDDEYWIDDDPKFAFKQPPGKPCTITHINSFIKMTQMMAFTLRTIYCIDKTKVLLGLVGPNWREQVIQQLNEAMDEWTSTIPDHLRWNPNMPNPLFASQSATLYTSYYLLLLLVYRPFIPPPSAARINGKPEITEEYPFPALAICVSAARAGVRILESQIARGQSNIPNLIAVAHLCGATLLLDVWESKKQDQQADVSESVRDVQICLKALSLCADRWESAALFLNSLSAGLPDDKAPTAAHQGKLAQTTPSKKPNVPMKPPMPPGAMDYPHERAMQPPKLTDGWHWFSQVEIGQPSSGGENKEVKTSNEERAERLTQPISNFNRKQDAGNSSYIATSDPAFQPAYPESNSRSQPTSSVSPVSSRTDGCTPPSPAIAVPLVSSVKGNMPWWLEPGVVGRTAFVWDNRDPQTGGNPSINSSGSNTYPYYQDGNVSQISAVYPRNNLSSAFHAGGSVQDWQLLAEPRSFASGLVPSNNIFLHPAARPASEAHFVDQTFLPLHRGADRNVHGL